MTNSDEEERMIMADESAPLMSCQLGGGSRRGGGNNNNNKSGRTDAHSTTTHCQSLDPMQQRPTLLSSRISLCLSRCIPGYGAQASLSKAWSQFEFLVLPRRVQVEDDKGKLRFVKAPPGQYVAHSTLYPAWTTPVWQLKEFSVGVAVYFETLLALSTICFVAGILYLPAIRHYGSDLNRSEQQQQPQPQPQLPTWLDVPLRGGSLMCTHPVWVPCPDCPAAPWDESPGRYATAAPSNHHNNDATTTLLRFALKNTCEPLRWKEGANHLFVMIFLAVAMFALGWYQRKLELHYDESVLTASDFSIQVDNPPPDATDPDEWKDFFAQFGTVSYVTVALNNHELLKRLQQRRGALLKASHQVIKVPANHGNHARASINMISSNNHNNNNITKPLQSVPPQLERQHPKLYKKIIKLEAECRQLIQNTTFPTSAIFVTFDKERDQRKCLTVLQVGQINVVNNNLHALPDPAHRFRGNLVLDVLEPTEPSAVRWQDLDETICTKIRERIVSAFLSVAIIASGFLLVKHAYDNRDINTAALEITLLNLIIPHVFKAVNTLESHPSEDSYQASLYWKITIFRWVNTAIVTILIKPFPDTLADSKESLIAAVHAVLRAEIMIAPAMHLLNLGGFIRRMLIAPFAPDQPTMNSHFHGATVNIAEKYTNATKTVFLVFFYAAIFPSGFFYGAVALFLTYVTDKFLLLRSWGPMPEVRDAVAKLSRKVFFPLTVVVLAITSEFFISAYPCDDLCNTNTVVDSNTAPQYIGTHNATLLSGNTTLISITEGTTIYHFCNQDFLERLPALLHFLFREHGDWMSKDQESMSYVFGAFTVLMIGAMIFVNLREDIKVARTEAFGGYSTSERDSGESYSEQNDIKAYIPQIHHRSFAFPLIAADLSKFDTDHLGWKDPILDYEYYNLHDDIMALDPNISESKAILSRVHRYGSKKST